MDSKDSVSKTIGKRINTLLAEQDRKQKELASVLNVQDNTVSYFCSGARTPNTFQIIAIAEFFGVSTDYLLGRTDVKSRDMGMQEICVQTGLSEEAVKKLSGMTADFKRSFGETERIYNSLMSALNGAICSEFFDELVWGTREMRNARRFLEDFLVTAVPSLEGMLDCEATEENLRTMKLYLDGIGSFMGREGNKMQIKRYGVVRKLERYMGEVCNDELIESTQKTYDKAKRIYLDKLYTLDRFDFDMIDFDTGEGEY
jgi:transcriptional regulator with XRE-family HTH domain